MSIEVVEVGGVWFVAYEGGEVAIKGFATENGAKRYAAKYAARHGYTVNEA